MHDKDFVRAFGKSWLDSFSIRYYRILFFSLLLTFSAVVYLANWMDLEKKDEIYAQLEKKYKDYIVSFIDEYAQEESPEEFVQDYIESTTTQPQPRTGVFPGASEAAPSSADIFGDLPLIEVEDLGVEGFEELGAPIPPTRFYNNPRRDAVTYNQVEMDGLLRDPYAYEIKRTASMYIEAPDYLLETDEEIRGYRDPDEIMKALEERRQLIEICYKKYARNGLARQGHVEVEFKISPEGYVIAESIRVLNSTINNKAVEQCIKKNIRRLPSFEKQKESQGIANIVHKFVFN